MISAKVLISLQSKSIHVPSDLTLRSPLARETVHLSNIGEVSVFREAHALMSKLADYWPLTSQISHLLRQPYRNNRTSALLCSHFSHKSARSYHAFKVRGSKAEIVRQDSDRQFSQIAAYGAIFSH